MNLSATFIDWYTIIVSGTCGYIIVYAISHLIDSHTHFVANALAYIGRESFYILTFHFLMYKPFTLYVVYINNLDWAVVGSYPVVYVVREKWYWIVYTISSVALSLITAGIIKKTGNKLSDVYRSICKDIKSL